MKNLLYYQNFSKSNAGEKDGQEEISADYHG